jgi:DnaJ-class molecular chaperone
MQVLSDPEKRKFYDAHGEEGLKMKEAYDQMDASVFLQAFAHSSTAVSQTPPNTCARIHRDWGCILLQQA